MDEIIITPHVGIGPFLLGMSKPEVDQVFLDLVDWRLNDGIAASYIKMLYHSRT
ncbi:hypothetical protein [Paenibacillus soyae]|uniref:Uncharacterized protein n=1 Tax=Paenibacillus soyae TaxID=2969249 RepID=A0A9X2S9W3_9BACL|nr:hypothetical protein [Paenibacillus soyae]MCR2805581.1 hypothetical protein [Paenibacillus soyae]